MFIHDIIALFLSITQFTNTLQANPPVTDLTCKTYKTVLMLEKHESLDILR